MAGNGRTVTLSAKAAELASRRAADLGFSDIGQYLETLIADEADPSRDDSATDYGAPQHLSPKNRAQLEALIEQGLAQPGRTMSHRDWDELRRDLIEKHRNKDN